MTDKKIFIFPNCFKHLKAIDMVKKEHPGCKILFQEPVKDPEKWRVK